MKYRNIFVANSARISTRYNSLIIDNGEISSIPLEDIRCVMLESAGITITTSALSKLAENGAAVVACDGHHMPSSTLLEINGYSRKLSQLRLQISATIPLKKRLWTQVVKKKIQNQASCLSFCEHKAEAKILENLAQNVKSGDPQNLEGKAAVLYFKTLFGKTFKRRDDNNINASLNYGYSLIRSYIARTLCVYGLEPSLGINHKNDLNNFNLADDLIEPFRPLVDLYTHEHIYDLQEFSTAYRAGLFTIMNMDLISKGEYCSLNLAIERLVQSLIAGYKKEQTELCLPELIPLQYHKYE